MLSKEIEANHHHHHWLAIMKYIKYCYHDTVLHTFLWHFLLNSKLPPPSSKLLIFINSAFSSSSGVPNGIEV